MHTREVITHMEEETLKIAATLATVVRPGDVLTLEGNLGTGKTTFTKGFAKGLGVTRTVNSPTYTIVKEYKGNIPLFHMDVYRLENSDEDIGFDEYFHGDGVTVVEWAHFIEDYLPKERLAIQITQMDATTRKIAITGIGEHFEAIVRDLDI